MINKINKLIKKQSLIMVLSILVLCTLFIGVSYSAFFSIGQGDSSTITFGDISISYCDDNECSNSSSLGQIIGTENIDGNIVNTPIYPYQNDIEAFSKKPYIFTLKNNGTLKTTLNIKLIEDTNFIPDSNHNEYERLTTNYANHLKVGIRNCTDEITTINSKADVNKDGNINSVDLSMVARDSAKIEKCDIFDCDVDSDGSVTATDVTLLGREINKYNDFSENLTIINYENIVDNKILQNEVLDENETKTYCMWTWLDNTTPNDVQKTYYKSDITIDYEYVPENK